MERSHPLVSLFADLARGIYPPNDGLTEVVPQPAGADGAILGFTGHHVIAADVDPTWVASRCPPGDLLAPVSPTFVLELGTGLNATPSSTRLVLWAPAVEGIPDLRLDPVPADSIHPRIARAQRYRADVRVYATPDGSGLLTLGRGLACRWEVGLQVQEGHHNRCLGRALAAASRFLAPPGEAVFMQVAIGNIASLRSILAAGFVPAGIEILLTRERVQ